MRALSIDTVDDLTVDDVSSTSRRDAFATFQATPMPSAKDEAWRYAELTLDLDSLALADAAGGPMPPGDFASAVSDSAGRAVIVDGLISDLTAGEDGIIHRGFGPVVVPARVDKLAAARRAFAVEGVAIDVPSGATIDSPFVVDIQSTVTGSIAFPSISVGLGTDAEASVIVLHRSPDGIDAVSVPEIVVDVGDMSRLRLTSIQVHGDSCVSVSHQRARVGRDATFRGGEVGLGGRFARVDYGVDLVGQGSSAEIVGLYFGEHEQTLDYRLVMNHIGRSTSSDVFLKGAVEDDSSSVFTGLLRIEEGAVRTSAFETNRNLVLSPGATAHSVPNLEILCDDVVCGHASSVGPLESEHLYYLMSRGLSRERAERVLVRGFFAEVIQRLPAPRLADPISRAVNRRFTEAQVEGRVG